MRRSTILIHMSSDRLKWAFDRRASVDDKWAGGVWGWEGKMEVIVSSGSQAGSGLISKLLIFNYDNYLGI